MTVDGSNYCEKITIEVFTTLYEIFPLRGKFGLYLIKAWQDVIQE